MSDKLTSEELLKELQYNFWSDNKIAIQIKLTRKAMMRLLELPIDEFWIEGHASEAYSTSDEFVIKAD